MRIIAGTHSGQRLLAVPGGGTRPTSDRVRESVFASLENLGVIAGARVLDAYAGAGTLGLEALSRGAESCLFVEKSARAAGIVAKNVSNVRLDERARVMNSSVGQALKQLPQGSLDVVFADPPYPLPEDEVAEFLRALTPALAGPEALVILERSSRSPAPSLSADLEIYRQRTYGETSVWFIQTSETGPTPPAEAG